MLGSLTKCFASSVIDSGKWKVGSPGESRGRVSLVQASWKPGSTIPVRQISSRGALPFYMTLARFTETSVQCVESGRCVASETAAGCRRACMTLHTTTNTVRSNRHRKLLPLRQT